MLKYRDNTISSLLLKYESDMLPLTQPFKDLSCTFYFFYMFSFEAEPPYHFLQLHPICQRCIILYLFGQPKICSIKRVCAGYSTRTENTKSIIGQWISEVRLVFVTFSPSILYELLVIMPKWSEFDKVRGIILMQPAMSILWGMR
jgi:hypothetical protein